MRVAVSPYHLTTREAPAMAALLLADAVVTLRPAPFEEPTPQNARRAAARSPRYLQFMQSWSWTVPFWQRGILVAQLAGDDVARDMRETARRIGEDERFAPLRPLMKHELFESERAYLDALGADLLKGGPDPGITVPLAAGLDRFAARHGLFVARAAPASVAQKAEAKLGRNVFAIALPVLLQASAERILLARDLLADELVRVRTAIDSISAAGAQEMNDASDELAHAIAAYAQAFDDAESDLTAPEDGEIRVIAGPAVVTGVSMPFDAVLRSSLDAVSIVTKRGRTTPPPPPTRTTLPTHITDGDNGPVVSLIVRAMGTPTRRR